MLTKHTDLNSFASVPYLTEDSMYASITACFAGGNSGRFVKDKPVQGSGLRVRPDVYDSECKRVWEFDGPTHYTSPSVILRDKEKEVALRACNSVYNTVRVPYFVQPTITTVERVFGFSFYDEDTNCDTTKFWMPEFPHGFIGKKCLTPAFFCPLGVRRFVADMHELSHVMARPMPVDKRAYSVATEILRSLWLRVECYGERVEEVYHDVTWYTKQFPCERDTQLRFGEASWSAGEHQFVEPEEHGF